MRDSATPTRDVPLRRLAFVGLAIVAVLLSCAKDVTGPNGAARFMRGFSWSPVFPPPLRDVGGTSSGVVDFNRVHVVLHHTDGTVALDTVITYPTSKDSLVLSLTVKLLNDAPASGEPMTLDLGYLDAAGDTVFKGGPIALTAAPAPAGGGTNPPVQVPVAYTGPGASATSVAIAPRTVTVVAGAPFTFSAVAKDAGGNAQAGTPVIWTTPDTTIATITGPAAGVGVARAIRGTARIAATLLTGATDTAQLVVTLPASQVVKPPVTLSGDNQTGTAGAPLTFPISVKVAASDGVGVAGTTVTFAVATGGGSVSPLTAISDANGLAQTTWTLGTGTGVQTITGGVVTLAGPPLTYTATATAGAAAKLAVTTQPAAATGGAVMPGVVVTAQDVNGNTATTFTGAVTMALGTTTSGAVLSGTTTVNAVAGVATFPTLAINKAFSGYTLVATGASLTNATTAPFNIAVGLATSISTVGGNAQTGPVGAALPTPIAVRVADAGGNGVAGKTVTFAATNGSVSPTSAMSDASGLAITTWTLGSTVGAQSMTATSAGLANSPLTITATGGTVVATKLSFTTTPVTATGGITLPGVVLSAEDASGNLATTFTGAVTLALGTTTSGAVLGGTLTVNAVAGVATFSTLNINKTFSGYTLVATASGLTSVTSSAFDINTGPAAAIVSAGGTGQTGTINTVLPTPIAVRVTDAGGNGVSGKTVTFLTTFGSVSPTSGVTDANGLVSGVNWTLGATVGTQSMTANSTGVPGSPLQITATGTAVVAGTATQLVFTTQPSNAAAGAANSPSIVVHALDVNGLLATSFVGNVTMTIGTNPGTATIGGAPTVGAVAGVVTFTDVTLDKAGTGYTLVASGTSLTPATSGTFNITPGPAAIIAVAAGNNQTTLAGTAVPTAPGVKVTDGFGNAVSGTSVTFTVASGGGTISPVNGIASTNGSGQAFVTSWTLGTTAGAQTLVATSGTLSGSPVTFTATATALGLKTWTGATSTAWTTATNWSPSGAPASTDSVFVPAVTNLPTLASAVTIKALTLASGGVLTFTSGALTVTGSLDATGGIVGNGSIMLTAATAANVKGVVSTAITMTGPYTVTGALSASTLLLQNTASLDLNGQAVVIGSGGFSTANAATITMNQAGSTLTTTGGVAFQGGDETGKLTAGTLTVGSNFSQSVNATAFNAGPAHTLILNASVPQNFSMANPTSSIIGNLIINNSSGVTALSQFVANNVTITTGALTGTNGATINGTLTDPLAHWAAGDITFTTSTTPVSATTPSITPTGSVTFANNPSTLAANLTINGAVNSGGNLVLNGHTLTVNGAFATVGANGQLTMTNAADVMNVTGNVTFGASGTGGLMTAGTLNIGGNFMQSGGAQSITTGGTNTVVFNGTGTQTVIFSSPDGNFAGGACVGDACFQNVTSSKSSGALNFLTTTKIQGNFTNSNSVGATIQTPVSNGAFIIAGNALFGVSGTYYKAGIGGSGFSKGAGTVIDSVYYFGGSQAYNPATLGESFSDIRGTSSWTSPGTLTGSMIVDGSGQLSVANGAAPAVVTGNFTTSGSGTLKMTTNATDSLVIGGNAAFGGGATTGLLTTGNIVVGGPTITNTGQAFDASGTQTTTFNATTGTQSLLWVSPVAGHGYNNLTLRGGAQRQFGANTTILGNMLIGATSGNVNGSWTLTFGGNITDSTAGHNAWNGSSLAVMTGTPTVLPRNFGVNTLKFSGGTVVLNDSLKTGYMVVDGATAHLKLNGHYVGLTADVTTQNGGVIEMTSTHDTLDVGGQAFFNGGSTAGLLTHGYINIGSPGFTQGGSPSAFSADSTLRTSIGRGNGTNITFANPGFGSSLSHFGELMIGDGSTHTLNSDVYVQGQITTPVTSVQAPITSSNHLITAQGANAAHLFLTNTRLLLVDGSPVSALTDLRFSSMDPTVTQFEVQRSGTTGTGDFAATLNAPIFNTQPTSGMYIKATDTNGGAPFLTINVATPSPAGSAGFTSVLSGAIINGWASVATATAIATGLWSDNTIWSTHVVPAITDNVVIPSPFSVTVNTSSNAHNLTVNSGGTLSLTSMLSLSGNPVNNGTTNCSADNIVVGGTVSMNGTWCGLRATGTVTLNGSTTVTGALTIPAGALIVGGNPLTAGSLQTSGTGVLEMVSANDVVTVNGATTFGGGAETGLLTTGTLNVLGNFSAGTGTAFDASGTHTTQFEGSVAQSIGWASPAANVGFKNVLFNHSWSRTFTSDVYIGGTVQVFSSDTGGVINGAHRVTLGGSNNGVLDQAVGVSAWQVGATNFAITGPQLTTFANLSNVDTTIFSGGGTVTLPFTQTTRNVVVDNSTNLNLNGHLLNTQGNSFTTQNGATLQMSQFSGDSLAAGFAYFNGGSTATTLTNGGMSVTGLYQGYDPTFAFVPGVSSAAFSPSGGLRTWLTGATPAVAFLNQGTGTTFSHFWFVQSKATTGVIVKSDVEVDSLLAGDVTNDSWSSDAPGTTVRTITTKGVNNSGTFGMTMNGVAMALDNGPAISSFLNSVTWTGFPANFTGYVLAVSRTSSAPQINFNNFSAVTLGAGGEYINNLGTISLTLGLGNVGGCVLSTLAAGGHCP